MAERNTLTGQNWVEIVQTMADAIAAQSDYLSSLDSAVGDGDHGVNLSTAMMDAARHAQELSAPTPALVLSTVGRTLINDMGGAAGVIFGSFFRGCARTVRDRDSLNVPELAEMLAAGLEEVKARGHAQPGDKTVVDALAPAVDALAAAAANGTPLAEAIQKAADEAQAGAAATAQMVARVGRAKFLGARSLGHPDAGAVSIAILLTAWAQWVKDKAATS